MRCSVGPLNFRMSSTSAIVNRALRTSVTPVLREAGFEKVDARNAWAWRGDTTLVFNVRSVGRYFADVTGWSPASVGVWLGIHFLFAGQPGVKLSDKGQPLPAEHQCHMRNQLERTVEQPERLRFLTNPAEVRRTDLWWVEPDGSNAEEVATDIAAQVRAVALPWYEENSGYSTALANVEQERDCFNKFVLAAHLARRAEAPEKYESYKHLAEREAERIGVKPEAGAWFRLAGR